MAPHRPPLLPPGFGGHMLLLAAILAVMLFAAAQT